MFSKNAWKNLLKISCELREQAIIAPEDEYELRVFHIYNISNMYVRTCIHI